jgi:hypothetical protein
MASLIVVIGMAWQTRAALSLRGDRHLCGRLHYKRYRSLIESNSF